MCQKINLSMLLDSLVIISETLCLHVVSSLVEASYNIQHLIISFLFDKTRRWLLLAALQCLVLLVFGMSKHDSQLSAVCVFGKRLEDLFLGDTLVFLIAVKRDLSLQSWMLQSHFSILIGESSKQNKEVNNFLVWDISHSLRYNQTIS